MAFIWRPKVGMKPLGTLGGKNSRAFAINNAGQIVGESETATGEVHATLWTVNQIIDREDGCRLCTIILEYCGICRIFTKYFGDCFRSFGCSLIWGMAVGIILIAFVVWRVKKYRAKG